MYTLLPAARTGWKSADPLQEPDTRGQRVDHA